MSTIHARQHDIWEEEHKNPYLLPAMDQAGDASSGTMAFFEWLKTRERVEQLRGIEMCCGKGRNVFFLAKQGIEMTGFDFSSYAIRTAKERAAQTEFSKPPLFMVHDAITKWPFPKNSFDIAIDNFGSSDIESANGRRFSINEFLRVLKPKGYLFVYSLSTDDQFLKSELVGDVRQEKNAYRYKATGKFEKAYSEKELLDAYEEFTLAALERIQKKVLFFGKEYQGKHFWAVFQKK